MRFLHSICLFATAALSLTTVHADPVSRPNILWITSEDNAAHWIGCYGNPEASTPRIDALAAGGLKFAHAYSNAPVCAVARSTILNGVHAVTQGTQHMRSRYEIPEKFQAYVTYLRELGYYCTNNSKTDYNFRGNDKALWDECSGKAHYRNRPDGKPFFAVFNFMTTHESQLFPGSVASKRKRGKIPTPPRVDPPTLTVPPHLPDLPEIREDIATYHDLISNFDQQVGQLLDELEKQGLADDTIVFYYSDHGGAMARGKRYLQDTGVQVPLVIHFPEKWRHLSPFPAGGEVEEPVAFVDFAPTVLSLAGQPTPATMQGRAFLGEHRTEPAADALVFLYADRFDDIEGMRRGLTDGRYKYIRTFTPHLAGAPYSSYPLAQPSWRAWQKAWQSGKLSGVHTQIWEAPQPVEMLFDTKSDPWEIENLAGESEHAERLTAFRERLRETMATAYDTSLVPEPMWPELTGKGTIYDFVRSESFPAEAALDFAFTASSSDPANLPKLIEGLDSEDPVIRYWAATGCLLLGKAAAPAVEKLTVCLQDKHPLIRITAAEALIAAGEQESGKKVLLAMFDEKRPAATFQWLANSLERQDLLGEIPADWPDRILKNRKSPAYQKDIARKVRKQN